MTTQRATMGSTSCLITKKVSGVLSKMTGSTAKYWDAIRETTIPRPEPTFRMTKKAIATAIATEWDPLTAT